MERTFCENKPIKGIDNAISQYLHSLFVSITNVKSTYIRFDGSDEQKDLEHVERVFAYELYHQWCNNPIISNNKELVINAEIPKVLIDEVRQNEKPLMYPDLVLHYGQNVYKGNLIICEIKRERYVHQDPTKLFDDLIKLRMYLSSELKVKDRDDWEPFKLGVFVMTIRKDILSKFSISMLKDYLNGAKSINPQNTIPNDDLNKRIVCIVYNGNVLKFDTLNNIIKKL